MENCDGYEAHVLWTEESESSVRMLEKINEFEKHQNGKGNASHPARANIKSILKNNKVQENLHERKAKKENVELESDLYANIIETKNKSQYVAM